jgi:predicted MPP superfamily phosphohydrolase
MLAVALGAHYYVFYRLWFMIPHPAGRFVMLALGLLALASPIISMLAGDQLPNALTTLMHRIGTSWLMIFIYLLLIFLLLDLLRLTHLVPVGKILLHNGVSLCILGALLLVCFTAGYFNYRHKKRTELTLTVNKAGKQVNPLKIVAVSDLHLGYGIGKKEFESWLPLINDERPDIVLIAGDVVDSNTFPLFEQDFAASVKKIKARYGVYAVLGNHEYIGNATKSARFLRSAGVTLLRDSVVLIDDSFYVVGRDDRSNPDRKSLEELIAPIDKAKPVIMLDHQPTHLEEAENNHIDLQLSGHTHNGQIWPISIVTGLLFENPYGYLKKGDSHIYVTSGLGLWGGKFRIGTRSEYVVIHLSFAGGD